MFTNWHGTLKLLRFPLITLVLMVAISGVSSGAGDSTRLLVYLEVPEATSSSIHLTLDRLALIAEGKSVELPTRLRSLAARDLAGKQVLLAAGQVPPGDYQSLRLDLSAISGMVGVAEVSPAPPSEGVVLKRESRFHPGTCEAVFLIWKPVPIDSGSLTHSPEIMFLEPEIPPMGSLAFVTCQQGGTVMMLNRLNSRVVDARWVDSDPRGMAYFPGNQSLFLALAGQDAVEVWDAMSLKQINRVSLQYGDDPTRLMLSVDRTLLFVLNEGSRSLLALSPFSLQQQFRVPVGDQPRAMVQDPVSGYVYVACEGEDRVQVVDPATGTLVRSLGLATGPFALAMDNLSRRLLVGGQAQRRVLSVDLHELGEDAEQNICGPISDLVFNPRTRRLFAAVPQCRHVAVIQPENQLEFASIDLPGVPSLMTFDQEYRQLLVVLPQQDEIAICNPNRGLVEHLVPVDSKPFEVLAP